MTRSWTYAGLPGAFTLSHPGLRPGTDAAEAGERVR
jgi:hypothetical protein